MSVRLGIGSDYCAQKKGALPRAFRLSGYRSAARKALLVKRASLGPRRGPRPRARGSLDQIRLAGKGFWRPQRWMGATRTYWTSVQSRRATYTGIFALTGRTRPLASISKKNTFRWRKRRQTQLGNSELRHEKAINTSHVLRPHCLRPCTFRDPFIRTKNRKGLPGRVESEQSCKPGGQRHRKRLCCEVQD